MYCTNLILELCYEIVKKYYKDDNGFLEKLLDNREL